MPIRPCEAGGVKEIAGRVRNSARKRGVDDPLGEDSKELTERVGWDREDCGRPDRVGDGTSDLSRRFKCQC